MSDSRADSLSTTPEVLHVRQGTGLGMARGASSHCPVLAPGPQSTHAPGQSASSASPSFLSQPLQSKSLRGEPQPRCVGGVLPTVQSPDSAGLVIPPKAASSQWRASSWTQVEGGC